MKLVFSMQVLRVYLFLIPEIRKKNFFFCWEWGGGAQVQHQLQQWAKYWYSIVWDVLTQSIYKGWKLTKIDATIICKPHAHPHIMKKTYTKFQNCKRSCAHNKFPLSIYSGWKMTKFTMPKKWQKLIQQLCPIHMHILIPWGKHMQSLKTTGTKL